MTIDNQYLYGFTLVLDSLEDYLASRTLIMAGQPLVAIQNGTTAIEKLFKGFLNFNVTAKFEKKIHSPFKLYQLGEDVFKHHKISIDEHFLEWLDVVYSTRYSSCVYPAKQISFGEKQFLGRLDKIFLEIFSCLRPLNEETGKLFFCEPFQEKVSKENFWKIPSEYSRFIGGEQKIFNIFFLSGRRTDITIDVNAYRPQRPFVFQDAQIVGERVSLNLDFGTITPLDLSPSYYEKLKNVPTYQLKPPMVAPFEESFVIPLEE